MNSRLCSLVPFMIYQALVADACDCPRYSLFLTWLSDVHIGFLPSRTGKAQFSTFSDCCFELYRDDTSFAFSLTNANFPPIPLLRHSFFRRRWRHFLFCLSQTESRKLQTCPLTVFCEWIFSSFAIRSITKVTRQKITLVQLVSSVFCCC